MATGEDNEHNTKSIAEGSEEIFDTCCTPCLESGRTKEADKFCVDCGSYFCAKCLQDHNKFQALRSHQILDKSGQEDRNANCDRVKSSLPTEICVTHHGKLVDMYCKNHDEVCCAACIAIQHRACVNVDYLPDIAKGINDSTEYKDTKRSLQHVLNKMKQERESSKIKLRSLDQKKDKLLRDVDNFEEELIKRIKELAETSKENICSKYEDCKKGIQSDLDTLDTVITTTKTSEQKLSSKNEAQLFVNIKASKVSVKDCEALLNDMSTGKTNEELKFTFNQGLKEKLDSFGCLSAAENVREYEATLYGKFNISPEYCEITGVCSMDDGTFVIADYTNNCLKRLDNNFVVQEQVSVDGNPYSVCRVGPTEVAAVLNTNKLQLASTGQKLALKAAFKVDSSAVGVSHDAKQDTFFVCHSNTVGVYTKSGVLIRTYEENKVGKKLLSRVRQLAFNVHNHLMFVTDDGGGKLECLTKDGKAIWTFSDPELKRPWGVCVLPGDIVLVSGLDSNNVLQVDKEGKKIDELIGASHKLYYPFALAFDNKSSRLVVGCISNEIHVYTLRKK